MTDKRLFARYGHECEINTDHHDLPMFYNSGTRFVRFKKILQRSVMASEGSRKTMKHLRSYAAITAEHRKQLNYLHMIHPFSNVRTFWEMIMLLIYINQFLLIPYDLIGYYMQKHFNKSTRFSWATYRNIIDLFAIVNIGMNFISGYHNKRENTIILDPRNVRIHYLKTYFIVDLISSIPAHFETIIPNAFITYYFIYKLTALYIKNVIFFRMKTFTDYLLNIAETFSLSFIKYRIITTAIYFILYLHLACCLVVFTIVLLLEYKAIEISEQMDEELIGWIHMLYRTALMVSNASRGVTVKHPVINMVVMIIWVCSKIFYILLLGRVMEIVTATTSSRHKYVEKVRQLREYMRHKNLPNNMQRRLLQYYEFRFHKSYFRQDEILNTISAHLRQEITMHSCRKLVENVDFFKNLPMLLLLRIVSSLKSETFLINDCIIKVGAEGNCMYFISTGTVAIYTKSGLEICHLEDGAHFGEVSLVTNRSIRIASVIAVEMCEVYRLDRIDFIHAIYPYPDLLNNIQYIAMDRKEKTEILEQRYHRNHNMVKFTKLGHQCEIDDNLYICLKCPKTKNIFKSISCKLFKMSMANGMNPRVRFYLKSQNIIANERQKHFKYSYMIHPFSNLCTIWETFMIFIYFFQYVTIPLDLCGTLLTNTARFKVTMYWAWLRNILDLTCCFDLVLNFYTGYFKKLEREVVIEPRRVAIHYIKTYFILDLLTSIPTYMPLLFPFINRRLFYGYIQIMVYVKHMKFLCYFKFRRLTQNCAESYNISTLVHRFISMAIFAVLFVHCSSCTTLYALAKSLYHDKDGIYTLNDDQEKVRVVTGYFQTLSLTVSIWLTGCNIKYITYSFKVYLMLYWIFAKIYIIYLTAKVMEIVTILTASNHKYVEMLRQLREYMKAKKLPENTQKRLLNYYEFRFQKCYFKESEIFNVISSQLKQEIIMQSCKRLVENVKFFKNLPINLMNRIITSLKTEIFLTNDVIVRATTSGDCMYFISTGTVAVYTKTGQEVCHLEDGSHFGEIALVMHNRVRVASVIAVEISELFVLERKDFIRAIQPYPDLLNKIRRIAAERFEVARIFEEQNRRDMYYL